MRNREGGRIPANATRWNNNTIRILQQVSNTILYGRRRRRKSSGKLFCLETAWGDERKKPGGRTDTRPHLAGPTCCCVRAHRLVGSILVTGLESSEPLLAAAAAAGGFSNLFLQLLVVSCGKFLRL